jgi:hypothetical protein
VSTAKVKVNTVAVKAKNIVKKTKRVAKKRMIKQTEPSIHTSFSYRYWFWAQHFWRS